MSKTYYSPFYPPIVDGPSGVKGTTKAVVPSGDFTIVKDDVKNIKDRVEIIEAGGFGDTTPPPKTIGVVLNSFIDFYPDGSFVVTLQSRWTASTADDVAYYEVAVKEGASLEPVIFTAGSNLYTIRVAPNQTYKVQVRAVDNAGNKGGFSDEVTIVSARDLTPPSNPTIIEVKASYNTAEIVWNNGPESDLAFTEIVLYNSSDVRIDSRRVNAAKGGGSMIWTGLARATAYKVTAQTFDTSGNGSAVTARHSFTTVAGIDVNDFTPDVQPIKRVDTLPSPLNYNGPTIVFNKADGELYRYYNGAWVSATSADVENNSITTEKLVNSAVTAEKLGMYAVTAEKIAANAVSTNKLVVANRPISVAGLNIRVNADRTGVVWDAGQITVVNNDGTQTTHSVVAAGGDWAYGTLFLYVPGRGYLDATTDMSYLQDPNHIKIARWNGGSDLVLYAGVSTIINGDRILTGTVNANRLVAKSITANEIQSGTIGADQIAANAITAKALAVQEAGSALNRDPGFSDSSAWNPWRFDRALGNIVFVADGKAGNTAYQVSEREGGAIGTTSPLDPQKTYRFKAWARTASGTGDQGVYLGVGLLDANGVNITGDGTFWYYAATGTVIGSEWTQVIGTFGSGTSKPFPAQARRMFPLIIGAYGTGTRVHQFQDVRIEEVIPGTLIQNGAITTNHITVGTLNGDRITVGTLDASAIKADSILASTIRVGGPGTTIASLGTTATWSGVSGTGKPQNNATVGAPAGTNVGNTEAQTVANNAATGAQDPATRINQGSTIIDPGRIRIAGSTTLFDWKAGGDSTDINGGKIAANTITANKLTIGARNIGVIGINFEYNPSNGWVYWSNGYIYYTGDNGNVVTQPIAAGNNGGLPAHNFYVWYPGEGFIRAIQGDYPDVANSIHLGSWWGGTNLVINHGGTIINGDRITTGSITANKLSVASLSALTANIGLLRTASSGARLELESNQLRVYDANRLRVRLGIW